MIKKLNYFAKYYLASFQTELEHYDGSSYNEGYDFHALCHWIQTLEQSPYKIDKFRLKATMNCMFTSSTPSIHKDLIKAHRFQNIDLWNDEEKEEACQFFQTDLEYNSDKNATMTIQEFIDDMTAASLTSLQQSFLIHEMNYCTSQDLAMETIISQTPPQTRAGRRNNIIYHHTKDELSGLHEKIEKKRYRYTNNHHRILPMVMMKIQQTGHWNPL